MRIKTTIISLVLGLAVFSAIVWILNPQAVLDQLSRINLTYLVAAIAIQFLALTVMAQRWRVFIHATGENTKLNRVLLITAAGTAMNNMTPSARIGGEPLRAYLLKKTYKLSATAGIATVIVEKIVDMTTFSLITVAAIVYSFYYLSIPGHILSFLVLSLFFTTAIIATLLYVSLLKKIKSKWIVKMINTYHHWTKKWPIVRDYHGKTEDLLANYYKYVAQITTKETIAKGMTWSLVYWALEIARAYVLFLAFGVNVPAAIIVAAYVIMNIIASLPLPPGSIEAVMIIIYSSTAINTVIAGTVTLIDRLVSFWLVNLAGLPVAWYLGMHNKE